MAHDMREFQQVELKRAARITSTASATGIDISAYIGTIKVVLSATKVSGTDPTNDAKLQESDTVGGTYTDVTGGGFTQLTDSGTETLHVDTRGLKSFIRLTETIGGTSTPTFDSAAIVVGRKQTGGQ